MLRAGLVASRDLRADARPPVAGEGAVDAGAPAGLALHGMTGYTALAGAGFISAPGAGGQEDTVEPSQTDPGRVSFSFDGTPLEAPRGMTVGGALLANGIVSWHRTRADGRPRGIFCGTGTCFGCLVDVGDRQAVRACLLLVRDGDEVRTGMSRRAAG